MNNFNFLSRRALFVCLLQCAAELGALFQCRQLWKLEWITCRPICVCFTVTSFFSFSPSFNDSFPVVQSKRHAIVWFIITLYFHHSWKKVSVTFSQQETIQPSPKTLSRKSIHGISCSSSEIVGISRLCAPHLHSNDLSSCIWLLEKL